MVSKLLLAVTNFLTTSRTIYRNQYQETFS